MDQKWKKDINDTLEKIETIGFFAAIGMHFAESTPLLSEELGNHVKGTPWETFSSTDQCFKMIHQLAAKACRNLEGYASFLEPKGEKRIHLFNEIQKSEESKEASGPPSDIQTIAEEIRHLKTIGESIVSLTKNEEKASELNHERVKSLGEMIINAASTIKEKIEEQKKKLYLATAVDLGMESHLGKPLELAGEELNRIKAFGACLVAMGMASPEGYKLNPRQIETLGQTIVDLTAKVTETLNLNDPLSPFLSLG